MLYVKILRVFLISSF